jgi:hypothetical protein
MRVLWLLVVLQICSVHGYSQQVTTGPGVGAAPAATESASEGKNPAVTEEGAAADAQTTGPRKSSKSSRNKRTKPTSAKVGELQPTCLYVVQGCDSCAGLMNYLRQAGVVLSINHIERGTYTTFPTVLYSDGTVDHGERIYGQKVPLPRNLCVQECETGA